MALNAPPCRSLIMYHHASHFLVSLVSSQNYKTQGMANVRIEIGTYVQYRNSKYFFATFSGKYKKVLCSFTGSIIWHSYTDDKICSWTKFALFFYPEEIKIVILLTTPYKHGRICHTFMITRIIIFRITLFFTFFLQ